MANVYVKNKAGIDNTPTEELSIPISRDPKLFIQKYAYWEGQPDSASVEKGKDLGFTIVFGNYGEADQTTTVTDTLKIPAGVTLKVMSISSADGFGLTFQAMGVSETILTEGITLNASSVERIYTIKIKTNLPPLPGSDNLLIPKHSVYCISILFQVEDEAPTLTQTTTDLTQNYGAVRFRNFNNTGGGEIYISNRQLNLGTQNRGTIDFGYNTEKYWSGINKVKFGYKKKGTQWVAWVEYKDLYQEYNTDNNVSFNTIQFLVVKRQEDTEVKLQNIKINGLLINQVLIGDNTFPKWNLEGPIKNTQGGFELEGELVLEGAQIQGETNKVEIIFGNK